MSDVFGAGDPWARFGRAYDANFTAANHAVASVALERSGLGAGMSLLDVAAGAGALSIPAARMGADVLAVDLSPLMLELLQERAAAEGLTNIRTQVMDGTSLDVDDQRFDRVCSQLGVMFFMQDGLPEMYRVTAAGGRAVVVTFGHPDRVPLTLYDIALRRALGPDAVSPISRRKALDPERLSAAMSSTGFGSVDVHVHVLQYPFTSADQIWDSIFASPAYAGLLDGLAPARLDAVRTELLAAVHERYGDDFEWIPFEMMIAIGTRDQPGGRARATR